MINEMTQRASEHDQDYMRRLGEFMAAVKADELGEHLSLSVNERLTRSDRLSKRSGGRDAKRAAPEDLAAFFQRARHLGLCRG